MKRIKKTILNKLLLWLGSILCIVFISSCEKEEKWEYQVVKIIGNPGLNENYSTNTFIDPVFSLNSYGKDGWELVTSYTEIETVHPNFGNKEYVTGLQPNTRTRVVNLVMKRKLKEEKKKNIDTNQ